MSKGVRTNELQRGLRRLASDPWLALGLQPPPDTATNAQQQQPSEADAARLKKAWRSLALKYHPDKTQNRTTALFATIQVYGYRSGVVGWVGVHGWRIFALGSCYAHIVRNPTFFLSFQVLPVASHTPLTHAPPFPVRAQAAYTLLSDPTTRAASDAARRRQRDEADRARRPPRDQRVPRRSAGGRRAKGGVGVRGARGWEAG